MVLAYVILHYLAIEDTKKCIDSILETQEDSQNTKIRLVVVDNGSPDDSHEELRRLYGNNSRIHLLKNEMNLGFAKGNNLGFNYAKKQLKADFIVLLNNDMILEQRSFSEILVNKFYEKQYWVLGPDIETCQGFHQNPGKKQSWTLNELKKFRMRRRVRIFLTYLHLDGIVTAKIAERKTIYEKHTVLGDVPNTILHGSCLIFSPLFIEEYDGLCPDTFLYMEEDILKLQADYEGFLMLYSSELQIIHTEDAATNMLVGSTEQKNRRKYKQEIKSSWVYSRMKRKYLEQMM